MDNLNKSNKKGIKDNIKDSVRVTSKDVARAAGVSQSLVSLILNDVPDKKIKPETREHVIEVAKKLNYTINVNARNMRNRKAGAIGLLSTWSMNSFVYPPIINAVQEVCAENALGVLICTGKEDTMGVKDYINYYRQNRIEGLIYISYVGVTTDGVIGELQENGIPFVCVIGARDLPDVSCVDVSFIENGYLAAKHLAEQGYKKVLYCSYTSSCDINYASAERYEGFKKCCDEYGLTVDFDNELNFLPGNLLEGRYREIILKKEYDAIVGLTFACSVALKAAAQVGVRVPDELGVISIDNEHYAPFLYPSLTTIDEPFHDMGRRAMNVLLEKISEGEVTRKIELMPSISVRESTLK